MNDAAPTGQLPRDEIVRVNRSSLRTRPEHASEQISQLRLGDRFSIREASPDGEWYLGAGEDAYSGWLRAWHLCETDAPVASHVVTARNSVAVANPGGAPVSDLSFGTRIAVTGPESEGLLPWRLPDETSVFSPSGDLEPWAPRDAIADRLEDLIVWGRRLLGVPYEWGGASSAGIDCSGLVQLLCGAAGFLLPRDSDQQAELGNLIESGSRLIPRPGTLLFYGEPRISHVGIVVGEGLILHASAWVRIDALGADGSLGGRRVRAILALNPIGAS